MARLVGPPGGDDVERQPAAADRVDIGRRLGEERGWWKLGRTATISSIRSVTAASAAAVDQASSAGASTPLMS